METATYNRSNILKSAWNLVKTAGKSFSEAMKMAWSEAQESNQIKKKTEIKIGDLVRCKTNNHKFIVTSMKYGYINQYRLDLCEKIEDSDNFNDFIPSSILTDVCLGILKWNKKFYGNYIYIDGIKYKISYEQREELSKAFEVYL